MGHAGANRLHHVGIVVRSIDDALPYFRDELRLPLVSDERVPAVGVRLALLDGGGAMVQLVEPIGPGPIQEHFDAHGEGLHHLCLGVPDIEREIDHLAPNAGVRINVGGGGLRAAFLPPAPNGIRIELAEVAPASAEGA